MSRLKDLTQVELFIELTEEIASRPVTTQNLIEIVKFKRGKTGKVIVSPHLSYLLGALLGDGCTFLYPVNQYQVMLAGSEDFCKKYTEVVSKCTNKIVRTGQDKKHDSWYAKTNNFELFALFSRCRADLLFLERFIGLCGDGAGLLFIEGFFDAEGCVKIIKEPVRKTPKICPDFTNTNLAYLELVQSLLLRILGIEARFSNQPEYLSTDGSRRKKSYHLRIYKKEYVQKFFQNIKTTKLNAEKIEYVNNWLELNTTYVSPLRNSSRPEAS
jgi:hypothetical protein